MDFLFKTPTLKRLFAIFKYKIIIFLLLTKYHIISVSKCALFIDKNYLLRELTLRFKILQSRALKGILKLVHGIL